jgi:tyrosinase
MWPVKTTRYEAVASDELELDGLDDTHPTQGREKKWRKPILLFSCLGLIVTMAIIAPATWAGISRSSKSTDNHEQPPHTSVQDENSSGCPARREWRTLSRKEQQAYISAVLCLRSQPSTLSLDGNRTAYDDFPWIHSHVGYYTHNSAPFLPWHRYFLHIYESTLRSQCGYQGSLVYWDWTLDGEALENSPVFDPETGFGGDGEVGGDITIGRTGCYVVDGPFAGLTADYYNVKFHPHCLSRGFRDLDGNLGHIDGHDISPESIEEVLSLSDYESFVSLMESRVHDTIPFGIAGDFETFTAPYGKLDGDAVVVENADKDVDPLFFLHHTQLDRLWWLWQQRQPLQGLKAYGGHKHRHSMELATLEDDISMQGLAPSVRVESVMDSQGGLLCYSYAPLGSS